MTTFLYTISVIHWVNVSYEIHVDSEWHLYYCIFLFKHLIPMCPKLTKTSAYINGIMEGLNCYNKYLFFYCLGINHVEIFFSSDFLVINILCKTIWYVKTANSTTHSNTDMFTFDMFGYYGVFTKLSYSVFCTIVTIMWRLQDLSHTHSPAHNYLNT
jgi:hypothetical protein